MTDKPKTVADWRGKIEQLTERLAEAEAGLQKAKDTAARAVLEDGEDASRELTVWRDRIDAVKAALAAAQRGLREAEQAVTAKEQAKALAKAHEAARQRHLAALDFDTAMAAAEDAYQRFLAHGMQYRTHLVNAGHTPPSHAKMLAGEAVRGAVTVGALTLSAALDCRPHSRETRLPLASWSAQQTPFQKGKAA